MTSYGTVISYPIPPYQNVAIHAEYYQPSRFVISAIGLGQTTTITTTLANNYVIGQECRLIIPPSFGTRQLNERKGFVISIPSSTQVILDIDSSQMDAYIASSATTQAQILSIGDVNTGALNSSGRSPISTLIPGSFEDISPL